MESGDIEECETVYPILDILQGKEPRASYDDQDMYGDEDDCDE